MPRFVTGAFVAGALLLVAAAPPGPRDAGVAPEPFIGGLPDGGLAGTLPKEHIRSVIRSKNAEVRRCWEIALAGGRQPSGSKLVVHFVIGPRGSVTRAEIRSDTVSLPGLAGCVEGVFRALRFDPPLGGGQVEVTYPVGVHLAGE